MNKFWNSRWYDNKWFLRIASLVFAVFLYGMVQASSPSVTSLSNLQQVVSVDTTETISNVPVKLGKHDDDIFVSQLQETVTVTLTGPKNIVSSLASGNLVVQTEDLTGIETGQQTLKLEIPGLPDSVKYQINPSRVVVQVARRKTLTVPVEYEIEEGTIASGMEVGNVTLNPSQVELTGNEENINKVKRAYVRISNTTAHNRTFTGKFKLQVVDADNKLLDVNANVSEVEAHVELNAQQRKTVNLVVAAQGESNSYRYQYQLVDASQIALQGSASVLENIRNIKVNVDVSNLTSSATLKGQLELPEGVTANLSGPVSVAVTVTPITTDTSDTTSSTPAASSSSAVEEAPTTPNQNGGNANPGVTEDNNANPGAQGVE